MTSESWIVLGIVLAILVGVYANKKGKSGFLYFILSIILSPLIGLLIIMLSGDNEDELIAQGKKRKCPNCGELIRPEAKFCKFCNSEIIDETTIQEDNDRFKISFHINNENSWNNIKTKLFAYYKKQNIENIISEKETSWMLSGNEDMQGYVQATLNKNIIIIESFKLPKPDIDIINSETKHYHEEKETSKNNSADKLIELGKLLEKELITQEEFEEEKRKILSN